MAEFNWNGEGIAPRFDGASGGLPVGKHPLVIKSTKLAPTSSGTGGKLEYVVECIDGPAKGAKSTEQFTLQHANPVVVRIAGEQLTALAYVVGLPKGSFRNTEELHDKPFVGEFIPQKDKPQYTDMVAVFTMDGRTAMDVANGVGPSGGGNGNAGNNNNNGGDPFGTGNGGGNTNDQGGNGFGNGGAAGQGGQDQGGGAAGWTQGGAASGGGQKWGS